MRPCGWLQVYGGVFHVANLKESSNPHYILREFLVHSADEVSSQWQGSVTFDLQSAGAPSPPHRRVMPDKCASITSRHGRTTECHMSQAPPWASCRYTQWPSPQWWLHAPQCDYCHCTPPPPRMSACSRPPWSVRRLAVDPSLCTARLASAVPGHSLSLTSSSPSSTTKVPLTWPSIAP